jgi:hypothetical protein
MGELASVDEAVLLAAAGDAAHIYRDHRIRLVDGLAMGAGGFEASVMGAA